MKRDLNIFLLAGTAEARQIAAALKSQAMGVRAFVSEPLRGPNPMPVDCDLLEFNDSLALSRRMKGFDLVLDASHGFDGQMTRVGFHAAERAGLPFASLSRPAWDTAESSLWHAAPDVESAVRLIPNGARVFSATGWASLPEYADFKGRELLLRQTTRHDRPAPFDFVTLVFGDPPFSVADEMSLFQELKVDWLICRNLGGQPSRPKIDAAKRLNLPVILIDRPALPAGIKVLGSVEDALEWVARI